jgi:hypothetical protein
MKGVAIERWPWKLQAEVYTWLYETFGNQSPTTWHEDRDYDLFTLVMNEQIYNWYILRWCSGNEN